MELILSSAKEKLNGQYVFLTPQEMGLYIFKFYFQIELKLFIFSKDILNRTNMSSYSKCLILNVSLILTQDIIRKKMISRIHSDFFFEILIINNLILLK